MKFERVVKQSIDAIQYDGTNIKEVYNFFCKYRANANDTSFEDFTSEPYGKRPSEIPLDVDGSRLVSEKFDAWKEKYAKEVKLYKESYSYSEEDFFTQEALKERAEIRRLDHDWQKDEEYHFYISTGDEYCRMIGISKGDWFVYDPRRGLVDSHSEGGFESLINDGGWQPIGD